jgi:ABC-type amino acid transport substrate-binding protein
MEDNSGCLAWILRFLAIALLFTLTFAEAQETTLARVEARASLRCGMAHDNLPGFFAQSATGRYEGFYADICRALAAATLGNSEAVSFRPLAVEAWFPALDQGDVDVLLGSITWTSSRDAQVNFATVIFHEGRNHYSPVVRHGDDQWLDIVSWVINALIQAEEWGVSSAIFEPAVAANPQLSALQRFAGYESSLVSDLGLEADALRNVIVQVGHYGEIYERNLGEGAVVTLPRGLNRVWTEGGLLYAPPFSNN